MNRSWAGCLGVWALLLTPAFGAVQMPAASYLDGLAWLGHASFRWSRAGRVVYFDPWRISVEPHDADLVLIGHPHFDHLDPASLAKVAGPETEVVTVADCADQLKKAGFTGRLRVVKPGDEVKVKGIPVQAVPAYNTNKAFHKKESGWAGFLVELDGVRLYHAGDTDFIPEMSGLKVDVALLPVSGTYVMTAEEAAQAAKAIQPKVAVPMHYGSIVGTAADAKRFQELCGGFIVEILEKQAAEELQVSARVDKTQLKQGDVLVFEIEISGPIREAPRIQLGKLEGFGLVSSGQSKQIRMDGGKVSQTAVLTYTLSALGAGTWTLGPVRVEYRGKSYETVPIEVKVLPGSRAPGLKGEVVL